MPISRPRVRLFVVMLLAGASVGLLLATRPSFAAGTWSRGDDVALATAWSVALGACVWLFSVSGMCLLAIGVRRPDLARAFALALPRPLRRSVEIALVASSLVIAATPVHALSGGPGGILDQPVVRAPRSLATPPTTTPAIAPRTPHDAPNTIVADHASPTSSVRPPRPAPTTSIAPRSAPPRAEPGPFRSAHEPTDVPTPPAPPHHDGRVVVRPGDNLWAIARAELIRSTGARPDDRHVARYWRSVVEANRDTLRSGNPSLIFPGEIVSLPQVPHVS